MLHGKHQSIHRHDPPLLAPLIAPTPCTIASAHCASWCGACSFVAFANGLLYIISAVLILVLVPRYCA
jgi:hypothetical protein